MGPNLITTEALIFVDILYRNFFMQVICGKRKFLAQLNERLGMHFVPKPEEDKICGQGEGGLSVLKLMKHQEELLFCVASGEMAQPELISAAAIPDGAVLIIINVRLRVFFIVFLIIYMRL
jgi:GDP-L-galactose phosphorylase